MKYGFIRAQQSNYPVRLLCRVMSISPSAYYGWCHRGSAEVIEHQAWISGQAQEAVRTDNGQ